MPRKATPIGRGLGTTIGWTHRNSLARRDVKMLNAVQYLKFDDAGLHISMNGQPQTLEVDTIIVRAGQMPLHSLYDELSDGSMPVHLIGGAHEAAELDAKRAIKQASYLAAEI